MGSQGNYRLYGTAALERPRFIWAATTAGFMLRDIATLIRMEDSRGADCQSVRGLIEARLGQVTEQLDQFGDARKVLARWQAECRSATQPRT
jgi:DNA-binding transcriptional MerR regulator